MGVCPAGWIPLVVSIYIHSIQATVTPCTINSTTDELTVFLEGNWTSVDLTDFISGLGNGAENSSSVVLSVSNDTNNGNQGIMGNQLIIRPNGSEKKGPRKLRLLCTYSGNTGDLITVEIPVTVVVNSSCHNDANGCDVESPQLYHNASLANGTTDQIDQGSLSNSTIGLWFWLESEVLPKSRTKRQTPILPALAQGTDKPPSFVHPECRPFGGVCADVEYQIHIQPGITPGIQPLQVVPKAIEARDLEYGKAITYKFINGTPANYETYFFMDPSSAAISQVRPVPHGEVDNFVISFMAQESGPLSLYSIAKLIVHVDNGLENLHDPVLEASGLRGYIEENAEIGTTVRTGPEADAAPLQILVTDEDLKPGMSPATYQYILMGIGASVFAVNQGGYVYLNVPNLDADGATPKTYALTIQAREVGTAPIRSSQPLSIKIDVIDSNDNEPAFDRQVYQVTAFTDVVIQDVLKIEASDADSGKFGELQYNIASVTNNGERFFRYNKDAHSLMSIAPLSAGSQFQVLLQATDGGGKSAQAIVVVDVVAGTTTTTTPPMTTTSTIPTTQSLATMRPVAATQPLMFTTTVSESAPIGTVVLHLGGDGREKLQYTLLKGNDEGKFRLDPETGSISTVAMLDREATPGYNLTVQAIGTTVNETVTVSVVVGDENDNAPVFTNNRPIVFTVLDGAPANSFVGRLHVEDKDFGENGTVKLAMDPDSPSAQFFTLDPSEGTLRTKGVLRSADHQSHRVRIIARDGGPVPKDSSEEVEIKVIDKSTLLPYFVNDNYIIEIDENVGPRELVTVTAKLPSGEGSVTYVLKQGDPSLFAVDAKTGTVSTLVNLDAENKRTHSLTIGTKENDQKTPGATADIEVRVKDVNDWIPAFQPQSYAATLVDTVQVGASVLQVTAVDQDAEEPNNVIRYRLVGSERAAHFFVIDPNTGVISVKRSLKIARRNEMKLTVEASDSGTPPLSSTATVVIQIQRVQTPAAESHSGSAKLPVKAAAVPDTTPTPTNLGDIKFNESRYSASIMEGADASSFSLLLPVKNKPTDSAQLKCTMISGNYGDIFTIDANTSGDCQLRLRGVVDRETVDRYLMNVSVSTSDHKGRSQVGYTEVIVDIVDINDNAPRFIFSSDSMGVYRTYFAALAPEKPTETHMLTVQAVDADAEGNNRVTYSLDSTSEDSQYFTITPSTGEIKTAKILPDRTKESQVYYEFRVEARDSPVSGQSLASKADVVVNTLTDSNRFIVSVDGGRPLAQRYIADMEKVIRSGVGECKVLGVEWMAETNDQDTSGTDMVWYAINPLTKRICQHDQFNMLFEKANVDRIKVELSAWLNIRQIRQAGPTDGKDQLLAAGFGATGNEENAGGSLFAYNRWQAAEIALIALACVIVLGAVIGISAMCYFWSKRKESRVAPTDRVQFYSALPKYNALMLPPSEKEYETQIMEMAVPGDRVLDKVGEADFSVLEEGIYSMQTARKYDTYATQRQPPSHVYIPPPDYPNTGIICHGVMGGNGFYQMDMNGRRAGPPVPAPAQRKRNSEKTTIL